MTSIASSRSASPASDRDSPNRGVPRTGSLSKALGSASSLFGMGFPPAGLPTVGRPPKSGLGKPPIALPPGRASMGPGMEYGIHQKMLLKAHLQELPEASLQDPGERAMRPIQSAVNLRNMATAVGANSTSDLVGMAAAAAMGSKAAKANRSKWNGLRHRQPSTHMRPAAQGPKPIPVPGALAAPPQLAGRLMSRSANMSAPNLQSLDTSALVLPNSRKKNFRPFPEEYELGETLGTGGYAVVKKAQHKKTGEEFAVKIINVATSAEDEEEGEMQHEEIMNELGLMQQLEHPNVIKMKEYFIDSQEGHCYLVMELLRGAPVVDALYAQGGYSENDAKTVMKCLLDAIAYMHDHGISHRDLKLENLVLKAADGDLTSVCIVDFGLAKAARLRETMEECCGTPEYLAPEIVQGQAYTPAVDVWSLGIIMYTLLSGDLPFEDDDEDVLDELILEADLKLDTPAWAHVSTEAKDLLHGLLTVDPKRRLAAAVALEHAWFTGFSSQDAQTLFHVHSRLQRYVQSQRLPTKTFKKGEWLVRQGQAKTDVFLLNSGECELVTRREGGGGGYVKLGVRRAGNFIGRLGVHYDDEHLTDLERRQHLRRLVQRSQERGAPRGAGVGGAGDRTSWGGGGSSPGGGSFPGGGSLAGGGWAVGSVPTGGWAGGAPSSLADASEEGGARRLSDADVAEGSSGSQSSSPEKFPPPPFALPLTAGEGEGPREGGLTLDVQDLLGESPVGSIDTATDYSYSPSSSPAMSPLTTPVGSPMAPGGWGGARAGGVLGMLMKVKHKWMGRRWLSSVRAMTDVEVTVLSPEDMQWAAEKDYRLTTELEQVVKERRKKLIRDAKAKKLKKQAAEAAAAAAAAAGGAEQAGEGGGAGAATAAG